MEPEELPVDFIQPTSWADALAAKAEAPDALPVAGGTDVMVELNFDVKRPEVLLDLTRITELADWDTGTGTGPGAGNGRIRLGAGVTYTRVIGELGSRLPGLAMAARTVGSPQIRNRGTVGGNLGAASPAAIATPRCWPRAPRSRWRRPPAPGRSAPRTSTPASSAMRSGQTS